MSGIRTLPLSQGKEAIIDAADYEWLSKFKWCFKVSRGDRGYAVHSIYYCKVDGKDVNQVVKMHRVIMGSPAGLQIDHINGDTLDNRRSNLRVVTNRQNAMNKRKRVGTTSQYKGVSWSKKYQKWEANIKLDGKKKFLGYFVCEYDAAQSYRFAAAENYGEYARFA